MMENEKKCLMELTTFEASEFEKMAVVLNKKLIALSKLDTAAVQNIVVQELEVLKSIQTVERERAGILRSLFLSGAELNDSRALEKKLGKENSEEYSSLHANLKNSYIKVQRLNGISRALLKHSLAFIRHNIHILTDGGNRKLVDRRA
ncbi:MAG: flagellar export chaperone FlgN [Candidatus Kryptoniota bacterium]